VLLLNQSAFPQSTNSSTSIILNPQSIKAEASPMTAVIDKPQCKTKIWTFFNHLEVKAFIFLTQKIEQKKIYWLRRNYFLFLVNIRYRLTIVQTSK